MLGTPLTSGGLFPLTRVFRMVGRSRDVSTLTLMLVFWVNAVLMALKLSSSAPLHTPSTSMDVTLAGPLVVELPPQAASKADAPLMLRPAAVARCKNWRLLMLLVVMYSSTS